MDCRGRHAARVSEEPKHRHTKVKICGITCVEDAEVAATAGADYIGMILWPMAKRAVSCSVAKEISAVAREHGARAVGVFVDEDAAAIQRSAEAIGLDLVQLHGEGARAAFPDLPASLPTIYVMHVDPRGSVQTHCPSIVDGQGRERYDHSNQRSLRDLP